VLCWIRRFNRFLFALRYFCIQSFDSSALLDALTLFALLLRNQLLLLLLKHSACLLVHFVHLRELLRVLQVVRNDFLNPLQLEIVAWSRDGDAARWRNDLEAELVAPLRFELADFALMHQIRAFGGYLTIACVWVE
jgi:hypothetical protein